MAVKRSWHASWSLSSCLADCCMLFPNHTPLTYFLQVNLLPIVSVTLSQEQGARVGDL